MTHYVLELALWIFPAYFLGCFIGAAARRMVLRNSN